MSRRLLITAGPTHEPIDAVRYVANRSSGRLGVALAEAGRAAGWDVLLLLGPTAFAAPHGVRTQRFETTADLAGLLEREFPRCDVLVMAAAVADYRPRESGPGKLERGDRPLTLTLEPTPDLVAGCAAQKRRDQRIIGFALEAPAELAARAAAKLRRKRLDAIVANPLETMGAATIAATLITADGASLTPPAGTGLDKHAFAAWLIGWLGPPG
jgi:phosphopantothenoylcysteine decarboxylase/phosphopantothenate--cysteine ligase